MRSYVFLTALFSLALNGCATMKFSHPTKDNQAYQQDWINCRTKMGQAGVSGLVWQREFLSSCMEGEGWTRES